MKILRLKLGGLLTGGAYIRGFTVLRGRYPKMAISFCFFNKCLVRLFLCKI